MLSTLTASSAGPTQGYIATGRGSSRCINIFSYRKNALVPTLLPTQPTDSTSAVYGLQWSATANFLVVATSDNAGIKFFTRSGAIFTPQTVPSNIVCTFGDAAISSDGNYVAAVGSSSGSNTGRIYYNNLGTLTNLTNVGNFTSNSKSCAVSSNGNYVAFLGQATPYLRIKVRAGSGISATYSDMTLASQPSYGTSSTNSGGLAFSPNGTYLAVTSVFSTSQTIYKFNSATNVFEKLNSPFSGNFPDNNIEGCIFNAQSDFLAIATNSKTFFFERNADLFFYKSAVVGGYRGSFHPSGNFYITGSGQIYRKVNSDTWTPQGTALTAGQAATFSPYIL